MDRSTRFFVLVASFASTLGLLASCNLPTDSKNGSTSNPPAGGGTLNAPPVIDALQIPEQAVPSGAYYVIQGTIGFHDDDDTVHEVHVRVPVIGKLVVIPAGDEAKVENDPITLQLSADVPLGGRGETELDFSVVDSRGRESTPVKATVVLQ